MIERVQYQHNKETSHLPLQSLSAVAGVVVAESKPISTNQALMINPHI